MALTKISTGMLKQDAASSDLNIDAGTLYIDVSNNRVGVANTSPDHTLRVSGDARVGNLHIKDSSFGQGGTGKTIYADGAGANSTTAFASCSSRTATISANQHPASTIEVTGCAPRGYQRRL